MASGMVSGMDLCFGLLQPRGSKMFSSWICLTLLYSMLFTWTSVDSWTYHRSSTTMNWDNARTWCQTHYTDMVGPRNQEEAKHLIDWLRSKPDSDWIGIRKIKGVWTWVGTKKAVTAEEANWANGEPNNVKSPPSYEGEDCVEMRSQGKWNDYQCRGMRMALCYKAVCKKDSCRNGNCVETVNSHKCACFKGYGGEKCEQAVQCPVLSSPARGSINCSNPPSSFLSTCVFTCDEGFEQSGSSLILQCGASGRWTASQPSCVAIPVPALQEPENGFVSCGDVDETLVPRRSCNFSCASGYRLVGQDMLTYTSATALSGKTPRCEAITCQNPEGDTELIPKCSNSTTELRPGSTCSFSCGAGFKLEGVDMIQCSDDGQWSEATPSCQAITCPAPEAPTNGQISCNLSLPSPSLNETSHPFGMICTFSCDEGYELQGAHSVECEHPGQWTSAPPNCTAVQCPVLSSPARGSINCSNPPSSFLSTCVFTCDEGFEQSGSSLILQCGASGLWTASQPSCVAIPVPALQEPENGFVSCGDVDETLVPRRSCNFSCASGYRLVGQDMLTYTSATALSGKTPRCEAITCQNPEGDTELIPKCSNSTTELRPGSTCSFSCAAGFKLEGVDMIQCSDDGQWSEATPSCQEIKCPAPEVPTNGQISCSLSLPSPSLNETSSHPFGMICTFSCDEGYELQGAHSVECEHPGQWTSAPPTCTASPPKFAALAAGVAAVVTLLIAASLVVWFLKQFRKQRKEPEQLGIEMSTFPNPAYSTEGVI